MRQAHHGWWRSAAAGPAAPWAAELRKSPGLERAEPAPPFPPRSERGLPGRLRLAVDHRRQQLVDLDDASLHHRQLLGQAYAPLAEPGPLLA